MACTGVAGTFDGKLELRYEASGCLGALLRRVSTEAASGSMGTECCACLCIYSAVAAGPFRAEHCRSCAADVPLAHVCPDFDLFWSNLARIRPKSTAQLQPEF